MSEQLILDPEVIKERGNTYTSITDIYQIDVFTDSFETKQEAYQQSTQAEESALESKVFVEYMLGKQDYYETVVDNLFLIGDQNVIIEKHAGSQDNSWAIYWGTGILIFLIFLLLIICNARKHKKRSMKNVADTNRLYTGN